jgi:thioredoxin 1
MKRILLFFIGLFMLAAINYCFAGSDAHNTSIDFNTLPIKGTVNMVDLGADKCIPCKMMAPILKKLTKSYKERAVIAFIDVWKNREQARKYRIRAIPTQIFFDSTGKEIYRHVGFMGEKAIVNQFKKMGVKAPSENKG